MSNEQEAKIARRAKIEEKQRKIMEDFSRRSKIYSEKNKESLNSKNIIDLEEDCSCIICKKNCDESTSHGVGISAKKTNIYFLADLRAYISQVRQQANILPA